MLSALTRKIKQFLNDAVLRQWLLGRIVGRWPGEPTYRARCPDYISEDQRSAITPTIGKDLAITKGRPLPPPSTPINLVLPGATLTLKPDDISRFIGSQFADTETLLGLHRFSWLPLQGSDVDAGWVQALWQAWCDQFSSPSADWPWHPYTAAERGANILRYAQGHGLPGDHEQTLNVLAAHLPVIAKSLEFFGNHHTSNHLANNGRGLYLIGLALGNDAAITMGARILVAEAKRIFDLSGMLLEESSHYHLLLTRNYTECWLAARSHDRPEQDALKEIAGRALACVELFNLPGGLPLIGDVSPDCPPDHLTGLLASSKPAHGWTALLNNENFAALKSLQKNNKTVPSQGWHRHNSGPWTALWHTSPSGWRFMPGHGHQDLGSFVLHHEDEIVFHDPGRRSYGPDGDNDCRAGAHNTLTIGDTDPSPPNRPYYSDQFRQVVIPTPPTFNTDPQSVTLNYRTVDNLEIQRSWSFSSHSMTLDDALNGATNKPIVRHLHTALPTEMKGNCALIKGQNADYRVISNDPIVVRPHTYWPAYGVAGSGFVIDIRAPGQKNWSGSFTIEIV